MLLKCGGGGGGYAEVGGGGGTNTLSGKYAGGKYAVTPGA